MPRLAPNQAKLSGSQYKQFRNALVAAYGDPDAFGTMLKFSVDKSLARLSLARTLDQIVFDVIGKAEDQAWTYELLQARASKTPKIRNCRRLPSPLASRRGPTCKPAAKRRLPAPSGA